MRNNRDFGLNWAARHGKPSRACIALLALLVILGCGARPDPARAELPKTVTNSLGMKFGQYRGQTLKIHF